MTPSDDLKMLIEVATPVSIAIGGWLLKLIWAEIKQLRHDQKEYVTKEMCRTHREAIQHQLDGYGGCCHKRQGDEE